jgi:hypothetical protein
MRPNVICDIAASLGDLPPVKVTAGLFSGTFRSQFSSPYDSPNLVILGTPHFSMFGILSQGHVIKKTVSDWLIQCPSTLMNENAMLLFRHCAGQYLAWRLPVHTPSRF